MIFVAAAAQGFFLFFLLLANKKKKEQTKLLAALILFFTLTLSHYITFWTNVQSSLPSVFRISMQFTFLFGPLLIGYLSKIRNGKLSKHYIYHFAPFGLILVLNTLGYFNLLVLPAQTQSIITILQCVHLIVYSIWAIALGRKDEISWIKKVGLAFSGYTACFTAYYIMVWTSSISIQNDYIVSLGMTIFIYFLGYHGFKSPDSFYKKGFSLKYEKSSLGQHALISIELALDKIMTNQKLFTNGDLKLQDVADATGISANDISQTINVRKNMKFTDYLNALRIAEALELMNSEEYNGNKLLAVAIDSGFNNKTSFLNAFKKSQGITPSQYKKQLHLRAS